LQALVPHAYHGFDVEGRPVYIQKTGKIHCNALVKHVTRAEFEAGHVWECEHLAAKGRAEGKRTGRGVVDEYVTVIDLQSLGLAHRRIVPYLQGLSHIDASFYPARCAKVFVINPPWVFPVLFNLAWVFLDDITKSRIFVLAHDPHYTELRKHISMDQLPKEYGGACECKGGCVPEPDATAFTSGGGDGGGGAHADDDGLDRCTVAAGKAITRELKCDNAEGATFTWYFETKDGFDIGFSVALTRAQGGGTINIKPSSRCVKSKGSHTADGPCTLVFVFDNSFSYLRSKHVRYLLEMTASLNEMKNRRAEP
jgi:hypothetical protein